MLGKQKRPCVLMRVGTGANDGTVESWTKKGSVGSHPGIAASCRGGGGGRSIYLFASRPEQGCTHPMLCLLGLEPSHTHPPPHTHMHTLSGFVMFLQFFNHKCQRRDTVPSH